MKVIIAGGRDFKDYDLLCSKCDYYLQQWWHNLEIISGCAKGADNLGMQYANERALFIEKFPANWDRHGKSAGAVRNEEMARYADALIAFWDGKSKGTKHMIEMAKKHSLNVRVISY